VISDEIELVGLQVGPKTQMELLLNVFWLFIAAGALGIWILQWRRGARRRGLALPLCALGCVLALLFPVISATDDLHAAALVVETSGFTRKILKSITPGDSSAHAWLQGLPALLLLALFSAASKVVDTIAEQRVPLSLTRFIQPVSGRAPPAAAF
jgi:hypothetical protein